MAFVLLHGLGGDRSQPLGLLGPVLPVDATVIAPDVRAHGASTLIGEPADFTLDALASEIARQLPREPLAILGISMGAAIALRLALRGDLDIEQLVLIRPAFTDVPLPGNLAAFPVMGELLREHGPAKAEKLFRGSEHFRRLEAVSALGAKGAIEQFRKPDAVRRAIRLTEIPRNAAFTSAAELAGMTTRTAVIAAPRDPVHPIAVAELWETSIPGATLDLVPARDDGVAAYTAATRAAVQRAIADPL